MITAATIWAIGWGFTVGISLATEYSKTQTFYCAMGGIVTWPVMLGVMIGGYLV